MAHCDCNTFGDTVTGGSMSTKKRTPEQEAARQRRRRESSKAARECLVSGCHDPAEPGRAKCTAHLNERRSTPMAFLDRIERELAAANPKPEPKPEPFRDALITIMYRTEPTGWDGAPTAERMRCDWCGHFAMAHAVYFACCGSELARVCFLCDVRQGLGKMSGVPDDFQERLTEQSLRRHAEQHGAVWNDCKDACPCCAGRHAADAVMLGGLCDHDRILFDEGWTVHQIIDRREVVSGDPHDACPTCLPIAQARINGQSDRATYRRADAEKQAVHRCDTCGLVRPVKWQIHTKYMAAHWCAGCLPVALVGNKHLAEVAA